MLSALYKTSKKLSTSLLDILFPRTCVGCAAVLKSGVICNACFEKIPLYTAYFCPLCKGRLPALKKTCHPKTSYILAAATDYNDTVRELIARMKYKNAREAAEPLAQLLIRHMELARFPLRNRLIIPIPLHKARERSRNFNQAALLAEKISETVHVPVASNILLRIKNTAPQSSLKIASDKEKNISGCFAVAEPHLVAGKSIVVLDDITTSGSTLREAAKTLKAAGAKNIVALVVAKA